MRRVARASAAPRVLTRDECEALGRRVLEMLSAPAARIEIHSSVVAATSFARGDVHVASETESVAVTLAAELGGRLCVVTTNRVDDVGLAELVADAKSSAAQHRSPRPLNLLDAQTYPDGPRIYFDATVAAMAPDAQAEVVRRAIDASDAAGLVAAGDLTLALSARAAFNTRGFSAYEAATFGSLSLTARTKDGTGSGWAWSGYEDWDRVDVRALIARAVRIARRSARPVAFEPGRYTVLLEPPAVAALIEPMLHEWSAEAADRGGTPFSSETIGANKIGLQMLDRRLGMVSNPWDPERPTSTIHRTWLPIPGPVVWFEHGVLRNLEYAPDYARRLSRDPVLDPGGVRLTVEGPAQSTEEMIASTTRGIWVNRIAHVDVMNRRALLVSGTTRDGAFLIENGKITKAIKNLRFAESPFFALNRLEAWGTPVRASRAVVCPPLKLRDFNFTSLTDAI